ncbi:hypothetical protein [Caldiplasma sukawensis]
MKLLISFGYDGRKFSGFQKGNGKNSISDRINLVMEKFKLGTDIRFCSRTDRNVSAIRNMMTIITDQDPEKIIGILNHEIDNMYFSSYSRVNEDFNVRHCREKSYIYLYFGNDYAQIYERLKMFEGKHDFSNFTKEKNKNTVREIDRIEPVIIDGLKGFRFKSSGFLWNQIRFIMGWSMKSRNSEPFKEENWERYLAPAENLILENIVYDNVDFRSFENRWKFSIIDKRIKENLTENFLLNNIKRNFSNDL